MSTHRIATREQWRAERLDLLETEKDLTRRSDELARRRQELPWVKIDKEYRFDTDEGSASLADLFKGRSQLLVYHFMFGPDYSAGCPSCSAIADGFNGFAVHLANHDVSLDAGVPGGNGMLRIRADRHHAAVLNIDLEPLLVHVEPRAPGMDDVHRRASGSAGVTSLGVSVYQACSRTVGSGRQSRVRTGRVGSNLLTGFAHQTMLDLGAGSGAVPVPCIAGRPHGLVRTCYRAGENSARTSEIRGFGKRHKNPVRGPYRRETWLDTGGAVRPAAHRDLVADRAAGARADHRAHQGGARAARRQGIRLGRPPRRLDVPLARSRRRGRRCARSPSG